MPLTNCRVAKKIQGKAKDESIHKNGRQKSLNDAKGREM